MEGVSAGRLLERNASTGPRSRERGGESTPRVEFETKQASTGPRSRERGGTLCRRKCRSPFEASTGPRSRERGGDSRGVHPERPGQASTGPRSRERGGWECTLDELELWAASTGPRSRERGGANSSPRTLAGHSSFNGAALTRARRGEPNLNVPPPPLMSLQRGRAHASAEGDAKGVYVECVPGASTGPRSRERGGVAS